MERSTGCESRDGGDRKNGGVTHDSTLLERKVAATADESLPNDTRYVVVLNTPVVYTNTTVPPCAEPTSGPTAVTDRLS